MANQKWCPVEKAQISLRQSGGELGLAPCRLGTKIQHQTCFAVTLQAAFFDHSFRYSGNFWIAADEFDGFLAAFPAGPGDPRQAVLKDMDSVFVLTVTGEELTAAVNRKSLRHEMLGITAAVPLDDAGPGLAAVRRPFQEFPRWW